MVAKEPARTAKNFGYEEMLSELEAIVADAETRLAEMKLPRKDRLPDAAKTPYPATKSNNINELNNRRPDKVRQHRIRHNTQNLAFIWPCSP